MTLSSHLHTNKHQLNSEGRPPSWGVHCVQHWSRRKQCSSPRQCLRSQHRGWRHSNHPRHPPSHPTTWSPSRFQSQRCEEYKAVVSHLSEKSRAAELLVVWSFLCIPSTPGCNTLQPKIVRNKTNHSHLEDHSKESFCGASLRHRSFPQSQNLQIQNWDPMTYFFFKGFQNQLRHHHYDIWVFP